MQASDIDTWQAMAKYGSPFARHIALAWLAAENDDRRRTVEMAFDDLFELWRRFVDENLAIQTVEA